MCKKTPVVEHLNMSLHQLARIDFKSFFISSACAVMKLYGAPLPKAFQVNQVNQILGIENVIRGFPIIHTEELNSIVLLLDCRFVEDDGVDVALLVPLWMGLDDRTCAGT